MNFKQISALIISFHLLFNQLLFASSVIIDSTAAKANQASLTKSRSGIDIVNIVTPNSKGLSHNKFSAFSVEKKGLILNNAKKVVNTQLAGAISYNPNLKSHAKLILNEVTGTNKTFLRGYTEIAGRTTDLIIANPNGITVNGGGFINTNKATLTTGVPQFKDGFLNGFNIHKGSIFIEGQGFNAFNINRVNLYSKYLTLNAKFHAKHAEVITGENNIDLNGNITSHNKTDSGIAIDSSLLGGIYVDSIRLSSTDKGVGVNLPPEVFAQDSLYLNANGDITIDMIEAGNGIDIESQTNSITSSTLHANNIRLKAKENITNEELIRANHTVTIDAKKVYNKNAILAGVNKQLEFDVLTQTHSSINITAEELDNTNATVLSKENVTINATDVDNTDGKISARKNLTIHASIQGDNAQYIAYETMNLGSSSVQGDNSQFFAKDIIFTADDIAITNSIVSATNNVLIDSNTELTLQEGNLFEAANDVSIESIGLINRALILSHNTLNLDISGDMTNEASGIIKGKTTSVFNVNELTNKGLISSSLNTNIKANAIENYGGIAVSNQSNIAGTLTLKANDLTNYNTIYSNGYAHFYILNELLNQTNENKVSGVDRARITVQKELTIQGNEDKTLRTQIITNHKGIIETKEGDITLYAQDIVNKNDDVEVSKDVINETWNLVSSDGRYFGTKSQDRTYNIGGDDSGASTPYVIHAYLEGSTDLHTKYALPYLTTKKQRGITSDSLYGSFNVIINDCDMDSCREETLFTYVNGKKYNPYTIMQQYNNNVYNELVDTFEHFDLEIKRVEEGTTFMNHEQYLSYLHRKADYWTQDEPFFASPINPKMNRFLFDLGFVNFNRYELKKRSGGGRQYLNLSIYQEKEKLSKPIDTNKQAILTSAKNLNIDSINLTNTLSHISAQKDIILTDGINVTNKAITLHHKKRRYGRDKRGVLISELTIDNGHGEIIDQINSSIEAGGTIKGKPNSLENDSGVKENTNISVTTENIDNTYTNTKLDEKTSQKEIELPTNKFGKFIIADVNEGHDYVVQSNPLYTSVDSFTGSDYFLEKMGLKKNLIKRLGDAEYETHMVQNAILEKAGKRFLKQAKSANEQYIDLMNQALVEKDILGLQVGQALSQEQLANLNQDIVWMEEKEVNGIKVLVPVVYLASDYSNKGASIIAGKDIDLEINSDVKNTGQLIAKENLSLKARSLLNQNASIQAGQTAIIETQGNIANKAGGNIKAGSLGLTSNEGSIINDTYVRKTTVGTRKANTTYTIVGKQSSIESTRGNLVLKAKQNINNNASIIKAKGSLGAYTQEGNINITTKELEDASYSKRGSNKDKYKKIRHLQSNISAGENIALNSGDDLNIVASSLNAKKRCAFESRKKHQRFSRKQFGLQREKKKIKRLFWKQQQFP
jgi:filamentous hemagglutinin